MIIPNSQKGEYAIETADSATYIVSTRVQGNNPSKDNPFTKENLSSLILEQIYYMDTCPDEKDSASKSRFMICDFNGSNINVTSGQSALFDFEYSNFEDMNSLFLRTIVHGSEYGNMHRSDTSPLPSNLRSFECYTLCDYIKTLDNANEFFETYLQIKGEYHNKMAYKSNKGLEISQALIF